LAAITPDGMASLFGLVTKILEGGDQGLTLAKFCFDSTEMGHQEGSTNCDWDWVWVVTKASDVG
jgi:hypothetical protein